MSITFSIDSRPTGEHQVLCYSQQSTIGRFPTREAATAAADAHEMTCRDCSMYGTDISMCWDAPTDFDVNMANTNAIIMLDTLNYDTEEPFGSDTADNFLGQVLLALAQDRHDTAVPDFVEISAGGGPRVLHCGTPDGYMGDRLAALADLATAAKALNRKIVWG